MKLINTNRNKDIKWALQVKEAVKLAKGDYEQNIESEIERYANEKITIAVVGLMKCGKSTFCNAFLNQSDDDLAPIGKLPATGIISKFCSHATRRDADVRFLNGSVQTIAYTDIRQFVTEDFNPDNHKKVDFISIYGSFEFDEDVELMDMPGDGSIHACHTEIVYRYLPQADVIIFLSSAQDPVRYDELSLLKKVNQNLDNIFFVINKVDKCDEEELSDAEIQDVKVLSNANVKVRKIYKISAKEAMAGNPSDKFNDLMKDIQVFLSDNKINLLRGVFIKRILEQAAPALNMLEIGTELKKIELKDLNATVDDLNNATKTMREQADIVSASFEKQWKEMVDEFTAALPQAENNVQLRVKSVINNYPMVAINKKTIDKLPNIISSIIEDELAQPTQVFEDQVRREIIKVNTDFPSITKYLADESYRIKLQEQLGYGVRSSIFGGMLLTGNLFIGSSISSVMTGLAAITIGPVAVGGPIAGMLSIITFPLTALTVVGMVGGGLFIALPIFGWIRGKKQQKQEILNSAEISIENAFRSMRLSKLPDLKQKACELTSSLNIHFEEELKAIQHQLQEAINHKNF